VGEAKGAAGVASAGSGHETTMGSCWSLLSDMLGECKARGVAPAPGPNTKFISAAAAGVCMYVCVFGELGRGGELYVCFCLCVRVRV